MLLRFRVANHRSIRDEQTLSLIGTEFNENTARPVPLTNRGRPVTALPVIGIFGANASGKSNLLNALIFMREAVLNSVTGWANQAGIARREPFKLDTACRTETSLFEVDLLLGRDPIRYTYGFELSDERVEAEWLHAYPNGKRQIWFDREAGRGSGEVFRFKGTGFKGRKEDLVELTRDNALFLTVGASFNDRQLSSVHRWFVDNLPLVTPGTDLMDRTLHTQQLLKNPKTSGKYRERITQLLAIADLGLTGIDFDPKNGRVRLWHRSADGEVAMDFFTEESLGTHAWFAFLGPLLQVLDSGSTLLVDELDSSLHPTLAAEVVRIFHDEEANPNAAQLIFTTHDATLLGNAVLNRPMDRDQIWLTSKRRSGETELYPVTDAKPRKDENLELGYLRGRYGGIPRVTAGEIPREVSWQVTKGTA